LCEGRSDKVLRLTVAFEQALLRVSYSIGIRPLVMNCKRAHVLLSVHTINVGVKTKM